VRGDLLGRPPGARTLPHVLDRAGPLPAAAAVDGEPLRPGRVYVAPPDRHLLVMTAVVRTSRGPRQNGVRPAANPLFRSAALVGGPRDHMGGTKRHA
jgi:two-component system chemotaxis response regulator CheB